MRGWNEKKDERQSYPVSQSSTDSLSGSTPENTHLTLITSKSLHTEEFTHRWIWEEVRGHQHLIHSTCGKQTRTWGHRRMTRKFRKQFSKALSSSALHFYKLKNNNHDSSHTCLASCHSRLNFCKRPFSLWLKSSFFPLSTKQGTRKWDNAPSDLSLRSHQPVIRLIWRRKNHGERNDGIKRSMGSIGTKAVPRVPNKNDIVCVGGCVMTQTVVR